MARFDGRAMVVTGGGSGIGKATATRLAADGARVAVWDLDADSARATADAIAGISVRCNVNDPDSVVEAARSSGQAHTPHAGERRAGEHRSPALLCRCAKQNRSAISNVPSLVELRKTSLGRHSCASCVSSCTDDHRSPTDGPLGGDYIQSTGGRAPAEARP